ncbi:uncharacterized protein NPIL_82141 [Nephila pilipes]|uniref:Uncharacterized protein n=1 Tax=Nephila pilipes TaxID=299642 RepID=A0A8X6R4V6_NEPPI|nr:uncharacterized protein NPIL_82141 [Nephila pilipes]
MEDLNVRIDYIYFKNYIEVYESIVNVLKVFDDAISLPIFLIVFSDSMTMYYGLVRLGPPRRQLMQLKVWVERYIFGIVFAFLRALLSFLFVAVAASSVHEASKNAKDIQQRMTKRILASEENNNNKDIFLLLVSNDSPPLILTAWGFFPFNRGLIFSAIGTVLTYSLLMMHISE